MSVRHNIFVIPVQTPTNYIEQFYENDRSNTLPIFWLYFVNI